MDSPISSSLPNDGDSASPISFDVSTVGGTLPIVPSVQPLDSRALGEEPFDIDWTPLCEYLDEDLPTTPLGVSVAMASSDVDEKSLVSGKENLVSSRELPLPPKGFPFNTPLGMSLPFCYRALSNLMGSTSLNRSFVWSHTVTLTSRPFMALTFTPQTQVISVASVPSIPTVCVASTTPSISAVTASSVVTIVTGPSFGPANSGPSSLASGVIHPMSNILLSSNSIPVGWSYEQYMFALQNLNHNPLGSQPPSYPHNPFHYYDPQGASIYHTRSLPPEPIVEVYVPLFDAWNHNTYHGP